MSLLSLVLTLRPLSAATDVPHAGRAAHAVLLDAVRQTDHALAESIHSGSDLRPFTASDLIGPGRRKELTPDRTYTLRLTTLTAPVTQAVLAAAQTGPLSQGNLVTLADAVFRVEIANFGLPIADLGLPIANFGSGTENPKSAIQNPWAASNSYETLSAPWLLGRETPQPRLSLQFASPTTFKSGGKHVPVPMPAWVFGSLLDKWNAFAPVALPPEVRRFAEECLALSGYRLSTRMVALKEGGMRVGAVGEARYTALNHDRYWLSLISLLADYALFAGVGAGAAMGLGQCRRIGEA